MAYNFHPEEKHSRKRNFDETSIAEDAEHFRHAQRIRSAEDIVCFGMVMGIIGKASLPPTASNHLVEFKTSRQFSSTADPTIKGKIDLDFIELIDDLLDSPEIEMEITVSPNITNQVNPKGKMTRVQGPLSPCKLNIVLYGPIDLFDLVGLHFQQREIFLQDPVGCARDVRYCNPHRLPPLNPSTDMLTTHIASSAIQAPEMQRIAPLPELIDILNSQEDLAEAFQPPSIKTPLAKHQKQALTFMLGRENGWSWDGSRPDIWEVEDLENGKDQCFINRISNRAQTEMPPQFYGGIIADPMGLGKTLSMIALVASDVMTEYHTVNSALMNHSQEKSSGRTLVVVPPSLLGTWEEQLAEHLYPNNLPWRLHHGKHRLSSRSQIEDTMIVLTTYDIVSTEWKNNNSLLFKTIWERIILDEAHKISNIKSRRASAICELRSFARWAVTGTPIQNELGDLASLLKFLRVHPYSEHQAFQTDIVNLWKSDHGEEACKRLKRLAGCLLLRRQKDVIELPPRHDMRYFINLNVSERNLYDATRAQALERIEEALTQNDDGSKHYSFQNVLQKIEAMRMICNLGLHYHARHEIHQALQDGTAPHNWKTIAQSSFNIRRGMCHINCQTQSCGSTIGPANSDVRDSTQQQQHSLFSRCWKFTCSTCVQKAGVHQIPCGCKPACPVAPISTDLASLDDVSMAMPVPTGGPSLGLSSKISTLIKDLQEQPKSTKSVVFSTWRMTLDLIETGLKQSFIKCLRFDGKVPQKDRQSVIDRFRRDPSIEVLLLTLSCGSVGLTLTVASRAYLMEPHWNPTQEDQALARIHRIGQTQEVTTVRFVVKDSFEERVIEVQDSKRDLASIVLNPQGEIGGPNRSKRLESLRALIK
ncbi:SNF2 family N-terminal domain-containing protein [Cladorrhinum sp. PSN259]|nr:SNF2 family N-terminal domain-containing protein [Cladorrhinum sp. PSN259]